MSLLPEYFSEQRSFHEARSPPQVPYNPGRRRQPSKGEWEELKPLIQHLYLEENHSLQCVTRILSEKHGFRPTKKQLIRKFGDWKFRKNANSSERQGILQNLGPVSSPGSFITGGVKITPAKLERWKKSIGCQSSQAIVLRSEPVSRALSEDHLYTPSDSTATTDGRGTGSSSSTNLEPVSLMENEEISLTKQNYNRWRIILESSDLNSIELSRLFAKLRIEAPDNFAILLPPAHAKNSPMNYQPFNSRIIDLTNSNNENYKRIEMYQGEESWEYKTCHSFSHHKKKATPFKTPNVDFLFPSEIPLPSTPLNELYPFRRSPSLKDPAQSILYSKPRTCISYFQKQEFEYKDKLVRLGRVCPATHPAMVRIMEKLGGLYYFMGKMSQSEHWYRRVITARQQLADTNSVEALQTRLDLIDAIIDQGRWVEAKKLHQEIYPSILDKVDPNHRLVQQSLKILARISTRLDHEEEAEAYSRQLLQLRLNAFGPWNVLTLIAMQLLATPLRNKAIYTECEDLLRIVLQLQGRVHDTSDHSKCVAIASLAEVLFYQKRYKEGRPLFERAAEPAEYSLGGEHPVSLYCNYLLARSLHMEGLLTKSKELFEANLEKQIRLLGETEINTPNAMSELGEIFMETGCYEEATIWLEKAFRGVAPVFGAEHNYSISICGALGRCYEKQERYTDAVALYKKTMQEITATKGSNHLALVKLQRWIDWNRDRLALPGEEKDHCVSGQSHLTVPSDCPVYSAIYKPQRHMLNIGQLYSCLI